MDGYWKLNNDYHLESVTITLHGDPDTKATKPEKVLLQNLRLAGPKGDLILAKFDAMPGNLKVSYWDMVPYENPFRDDLERPGFVKKVIHELRGTELSEIVQVVNEGKQGSKGLCVLVKPGKKIHVTLTGLDLKFNLNDEFTRISYDYKAITDDPWLRRDKGWRYGQTKEPVLVGDIFLNDRGHAPAHQRRGGILIEESLKVENTGADSFGQFSYCNYFGAHSKWTRQTVLTEEGYLVVRDVYEPGTDVNGYQAAPCWLLRAEGDVQGGDRNWFDAPAWDHAWWQKQKKRVLLYLHPGQGLTFGQAQHASSQDIGGSGSIHSSFAKAKVKAGKPQTWLSVLLPFNEGEDAATVAKRIKTSVDKAGKATARIGNVKVTIDAAGQWTVTR